MNGYTCGALNLRAIQSVPTPQYAFNLPVHNDIKGTSSLSSTASDASGYCGSVITQVYDDFSKFYGDRELSPKFYSKDENV